MKRNDKIRVAESEKSINFHLHVASEIAESGLSSVIPVITLRSVSFRDLPYRIGNDRVIQFGVDFCCCVNKSV